MKKFNEFLTESKRLDDYYITVTITAEFDSGYAEWVDEDEIFAPYSKNVDVYYKNNREYVKIQNVSYKNLKKLLDYIHKAPQDSLEDEIIKVEVTIV